MRYCRFRGADGQPQYGLLREQDHVLWIAEAMQPPEEEPLAIPDAGFVPKRFTDVELLPPVRPGKIVCVGRNYRDHAAELGNPVPAEPMLFFKPSSSLLAPGGLIEIPAWAGRVDFEGELALVIGQRLRHLGADEDPSPYIRGYTLLNDVSARELQKRDGQWARAKGMDTFCPVGPWVSDELLHQGDLTLETRQNGILRQSGTTRDLIFPIAVVLRAISAGMTLEPGDLVATGTPAGVAAMADGDEIAIHAEGLGTLQNRVRVT